MKRGGTATWKGGLKDGWGVLSTNSRALRDLEYSFAMRFESTPGTNPEELIAAAHAGCFSMAFSAELGKAGLTPEVIETSAIANFEKTDAGWTVTSIHLDAVAKVPDADHEAVQAAAEAAKKGCPVSRLLNTRVTMALRIL